MHTSVSTALVVDPGQSVAQRGPTAQQRAVLEFMFAFHRDEDRLPTRAEIAAHFNWRSANSAEEHVQQLVRHGYVEKRGPNLRFARSRKGWDARDRWWAKEQGEQSPTTPADLETA